MGQASCKLPGVAVVGRKDVSRVDVIGLCVQRWASAKTNSPRAYMVGTYLALQRKLDIKILEGFVVF
jgi:hypothetical protein